MKRVGIVFAGALLAGCTTDATVRSKPPYATYTSSKSADTLVGCLTTALTKRYNASAALQDNRFVGQVIVPGREYDIVPVMNATSDFYLFTINVKAEGNRTRVNFFRALAPLPSMTEAMKLGIAGCI